jgi:hypothetical protein
LLAGFRFGWVFNRTKQKVVGVFAFFGAPLPALILPSSAALIRCTHRCTHPRHPRSITASITASFCTHPLHSSLPHPAPSHQRACTQLLGAALGAASAARRPALRSALSIGAARRWLGSIFHRLHRRLIGSSVASLSARIDMANRLALVSNRPPPDRLASSWHRHARRSLRSSAASSSIGASSGLRASNRFQHRRRHRQQHIDGIGAFASTSTIDGDGEMGAASGVAR